MSTDEYDIDLIQKGQWLLHHVKKNGNPFNKCAYLKINGLDVEVIKKAVMSVMNEHDCLRTSFAFCDGILKHKIHPLEDLTMDEILKVNFWNQPNGEIDLEAICEEEMVRPFDLNKSPLIRINFWFCGSDSYLFCTMHHVIFDAKTFPLFYKQLSFAYEKHLCGSEDKFPEVIQYREYFNWKKGNFKKVSSEVKAFWRQNFKSIPTTVAISHTNCSNHRSEAKAFEDGDLALLSRVLPTDDPQGGVYDFCISPDLTTKIVDLQKKYGCSVYTTMLTCFSVLLSYTYNRQDNILTFSVSDREHFGHKNIIGWLVSSATFLGRIDKDSSLEDILEYSINEFLRAVSHRFYPVDKILEDTNVFVPYNKIVPLYLNYFVVAETKRPVDTEHKSSVKMTANHDLNCTIYKYENVIEIKCVYNESVFSLAEISKLFKQYLTIMHCLLEDSEKKIKDLFKLLD